MGQRGPKPLPGNVHQLRGNPSKKAKRDLVDGVQPEVKIPSCPDHLSAEAKREWNRITKVMKNLGIISDLDRATLAIYCQAWGRWEQLNKKIKKLEEAQELSGLVDVTPKGFEQMTVYVQLTNRYADQIKQYIAEFGLSPSARTRLKPAIEPEKSNGKKEGPERFFE